MPNGLRTMFPLALLLAFVLSAPPLLHAQVYRCESESGVTYSDMPCGASAEQIQIAGDVMDSRGVGGSAPEGAGVPPFAGAAISSAPEGETRSLDATISQTGAGADEAGEQTLNDFLEILRSQREQQIGLIDHQLAQLRVQAGNAEGDEQQALSEQIASLEANKASIESEYEALIVEAESRLD